MNADEIKKAILDAYALGKRHAQADIARGNEIDKLLSHAASFAEAPKRTRKPKEAAPFEDGAPIVQSKAEEPKAKRGRKPKEEPKVNGSAVLGEEVRPSSDFPM